MRLPEMWEGKQAELRSFSQPTLTLPQLCGREVSLPFKVQHAWLRQGHKWGMSCGISTGSSVQSSSASLQWPPCQSTPPFLGAEALLLPFSQFDYWEAAKAGAAALPPLGWVAQVSLTTVGKVTLSPCMALASPDPQNEHQEHPAQHCGLDGAWWRLRSQSCSIGEGTTWKKILLRVLHKAAQPLSLTNVLHF